MNVKLYLTCFLVIFVGKFCFLSCITVEEELTLTKEEKNVLDKFKSIVEQDPSVREPYMKEDIYLIKWVRVGKLDLLTVQDLFKANLKWRHENKIDTILEEDFSTLKETFPIYLHGEDKTGRPILAADAGSWDVRRGVISGLRESTVRYIYQAIELQCKKIRDKQQLGQNVTQMQVVLDLSGYNIVQHGCLNCISVYVDFIRTFLYRYPYMTDSLILVNAPAVFDVVADALNLRHGRTVRIKIFGTNKSEWKKYLFNIISEEQLPKFLGGIVDSDNL